MPDSDFKGITDIATLKEACARTYYTIDGLWFLAVENSYGFEKAFEMNQEVWHKAGPIIGRRLLKNLDIEGKPPLRQLFELVFADPLISVHKPESVTLEEKRAVLRFMEYPVQAARIRDGRGVYDGKPGCTKLFDAYAALIDPRIKVECVACAPNPENPEYWCEWEFVIPED
jgi:hypothetical protein